MSDLSTAASAPLGRLDIPAALGALSHPPTDTDQETTITDEAKPVRPTEDIRRRMLAGEPLTGAQVAEDYGVDRATLGNVVAELRREHTVEAVIIPGNGNPKRYTVTSVSPNREVWGKGPNVLPSLRAQRAEAKASPKVTEPKAAAQPAPAPRPKRKRLDHPVPELGSSLAVNALSLTDDNVVALSIENETGRWLVEVVAYAKRETES